MKGHEASKRELREYALGQGIDMMGFAGVDRFAEEPSEFHPRSIYPGVKTVVVLGIRVFRGGRCQN